MADAGMDNGPSYINPAYLHHVYISGSAGFTVPTCRMPEVAVDLGKHRESDFPSTGSRRGSRGTYSDFEIDLANCYADKNAFSYSLRPLSGVVAGVRGMMNLAPASTARGIAIRITDRSDAPIAFNSTLRTNFASGVRRILLRASMERTGAATFAGGSVTGYVVFTISYG